LALLINLDEILGDMSSSQSTPSTRTATPSALETSVDVEVTANDLGRCDIQGIDWSTYAVSRETYRDIRIKEYKEFEAAHELTLDIIADEDDADRIKYISPSGPMLSFHYTNKADTCYVPHFQLRHLLQAPTNRTVIFPHFSRIKCWNPVLNSSEMLFNTIQFGPQFSKVSVIAATKSVLFIGGFSGEVITLNLECRRDALRAGENLDYSMSDVRLKTYSTDPNCITNHLEPLEADGKLLISCNDAVLRLMDIERGIIRPLARFPYPLNASAVSHDKKLIATVGDSRKVRLLDYNTCREVGSLSGHLDFSFSCAWSPCGRYLASGSQDRSARIFDARMLGRPAIHTLVANMAAIRNVKFSDCGSLLAVAEADDYVNVYNVHSDFREYQIIDFFGETSGIDFDPDSRHLYIGCAGGENGGIFEFRNLVHKWNT